MRSWLFAIGIVLLAPFCATAGVDPTQITVTPQLGHAEAVSFVAFSPDGRTVASAGGSTLKLWDAESGRLLRSLAGQGIAGPNFGTEVTSAAFSPDGRTIVSGSYDTTLKLWDAASGRLLSTLKGHGAQVHDVAFSPDGRSIVSGSSDKTLKLWDAASGRLLRTLEGHGNEVLAAAFSPDGHTIVSSSTDQTLKLWDVASGRVLRTFPSQRLYTSVVAFSPDGRTIISAGGLDDKTVKLWDAASGRLLRTLAGHSGEVSSAAFSPDGRTIVSGSFDKTVRLWDATSGRELRTLAGHGERVFAVAISPDGRIASGSMDKSVKLWDAATGRLLRTLTGCRCDVRAAAFSPDGHTIASGGIDKTVKLWDAASGRVLHTLADAGEVWAAAFSPDGHTIASGSSDRTVKLWDAGNGRELRALAGHGNEVMSLAYSPDGRTIVSANGDNKLKLWDAASGRVLRTLLARQNYQGYIASTVAFSPDGRTIASGSMAGFRNGALKLWDAASGRELRSLPVEFVYAVAFSPDSRTLFSANNATLKLWDAVSGRELRSLGDYQANAVAFAPDGSTMVSGSGDSTLTLWDAKSGRKLHVLEGHVASVSVVAYSPEGSKIVSGSSDGTWRLWSKNGEQLTVSFATEDGEWVTMTPEGFFDSSPNGAKMLNVVRGLEVYSVSQFYPYLYRPDLVREKLAGDPDGLVKEAAAKLDLVKVLESRSAPHVAIVTPASGATSSDGTAAIEARLTDKGGGIGNVEWRVNGVVLGLDRAAAQLGSEVILRKNLALVPGQNRIEVIAYNRTGRIVSSPAEVRIHSTQPNPTRPPRLFVLSAGVNDYANSHLSRLSFAVADAKAIGAAMKQLAGALYSDVEVKMLANGEVTTATLDKAFAELATKVSPDDVFVFFLSGHGHTVDGRFYFIPQDYKGSSFGSDQLTAEAISQDQLQEWFTRILAHKALLLTDACHSGALVEDRVSRRGLADFTAASHLTQSLGRAVMAATTDDTRSWEAEGFDHGVFTYALLAGFAGADAKRNSVIDVESLGSFVRETVPELTWGAWHLIQVPQVRITGANFALVQAAATPLVPAVPKRYAVPSTPTNILASATTARQAPNPAALEVAEIETGAPVTLIPLAPTAVNSDWSLVARQGRILGYVETKSLKAAQ